MINRLKAGEEAAFRTLVEIYQGQVYHTCFGVVQRSEEAEDLAQEVFMEVHRSVGAYRGEAKLSTWIYRIATTKSLEWIRRSKRQKRWAFFSAQRGEDSGILQVADREAHPGLALENQERGKVLFAAMDRLAINQRMAFSLHKVDGLSYQEVADAMQVSVSSVESLMFRAKKNLQKLLRDYYVQEHE